MKKDKYKYEDLYQSAKELMYGLQDALKKDKGNETLHDAWCDLSDVVAALNPDNQDEDDQ